MKWENVEFALRRKDLREEFLKYLIKVVEKESKSIVNDEATFACYNFKFYWKHDTTTCDRVSVPVT